VESDIRRPRASLAAIGAKLKAAREGKGLTIDQVQKKTRISPRVIASLEDGTCDAELTATYTKSFLKAYALHLGLDAEEILKEYSNAHPSGHVSPQITAAGALDTRRSDLVLKTVYFLSIVLLATAVFFLGRMVWKKAAPSFKRPKAAVSSYAKRYKRPVKAAAPVAAKRSLERAPAYTSISIPQKEQLKLVIVVKQDVFIQLKRDGSILFARVLPKGTVETFTAENRFNIFTGKAEAIELTLNGRYLGPPGRGSIKDLEITRKGIQIK
jgi:transcriptional regulator with XRE-family HTH domain